MDGNGANGGGYVNERFEELMAEAETFTVEEELDTLMVEIQQILIENDPAAIFYGETKYYTILQKDIGGFVPNPLYLGTHMFYDLYREVEA